MIKVSVMYPNTPGVRFDIDYYCDSHMVLVRECLGDACKGITVDHGIAGGGPGSPATYVAVGHLLFDNLEDFQSSFGPNSERLMGDLPNFTDAQPVIQISSVRMVP